jgi:hypothetical protein
MKTFLSVSAIVAALALTPAPPATAVSPSSPCVQDSEIRELRLYMERRTAQDILDGPGVPFALVENSKGWEVRHYTYCGYSFNRVRFVVMYYTGTAADVDRLDYAGVIDFGQMGMGRATG